MSPTLRVVVVVVASSFVSVAACGSGDPATDGEIVDRLREVPGVSAVLERPAPDSPGYRFFEMTIEQPTDGDGSETFPQYLTFLYAGDDRPVVLATTGYDQYLGDALSEPAALLGANQLTVEHRFFATSRPADADWRDLDVERSAEDFHHIVEAFRPRLGDGAWIGTGVSKGGVTSVLHRRYFPDDVDGTIAYVAPLSYGTDDPRYAAFLETIGPDDCRQRVRDVQRMTLERRATIVDRARQDGGRFDLVGADLAVETAIAEEDWSFWQYFGEPYCSFAPDPAAATDDDLYFFLRFASPPFDYDDREVVRLQPYYYQSATQLGYPSVEIPWLADLLEFDPNDLTPFLPDVELPAFDDVAMEDLSGWLDGSAERVMLIYGEWDPWTGGAMDPGASPESYVFVEPHGSHRASIGGLAVADRTAALAALADWSGVALDLGATARVRVLDPGRPTAPRR
jgi:hypothetical protein